MRDPLRPNRPSTPSWRLSAFVLTVAATAALLLVPGRPARGDDRDLLRTTGAVPYVFFILDTSESMNADIFGNPVPLNGDDPRAKIFMAKKQLYHVFADASQFRYGFAHYNQDETGVLYKHWLFRAATEPAWANALDYPRLDDPATTTADESDLWVFGKKLTDAASIDRVDDCTASELLDIDDPDAREALNRFVKGGELLNSATTVWFAAGNRVYRMSVGSPGHTLDMTAAPSVITSTVTLDEFDNCSDTTPTTLGTTAVKFELVDDFLFMETTEAGSGAKQSGLDADENLNGYWTWRDVTTTQVCGDSQRGRGIESNYDSNSYEDAETGVAVSAPTDMAVAFDGGSPVDVDVYCRNASDPTRCPAGLQGPNLMVSPTLLRDEGRPVDAGDFLPYDWDDHNHAEFLRRLNPNHKPDGPPADFGIAAYFRNVRTGNNKWLEPVDPARVPLIAAGDSPLADSINDYRCWLTNKATGQCKDGWFPCANRNDPNCQRWSPVAAREMGNAKGCVQPYLIIVTDAENSCTGPAPASNTAGLKSAEGVKTWVIAMRPNGSAPGQIQAITKNGSGELVYVENEQQLEDALKEIRGTIEQETRAFASAAVPTVQATVAQQIYLSSFTPLEDQAVWPGQVHSFLKPLPLLDGKPDVASERHNWDAGQAILTQNGGIGPAANQRRVYTSRQVRGPSEAAGSSPTLADDDDLVPVERGEVPGFRTLLPVPPASTADATVAEWDLWRGLGYTFNAGPNLTPTEEEARAAARDVLATTYTPKTGPADIDLDGDGNSPDRYVLGDVFHSDPVIVGSPANIRYFASNLEGYRDFARQQENRRKVLLVGSNDGMLHAFDAGQPRLVQIASGVEDVEFDNGTGKELFAYVPRAMLPEVRDRAANLGHDWGVDGSVNVADVHIDPVFQSVPDDDDREWRTVLVGGFRRGAPGYYALDLTQPDPIGQEQVGSPQRTIFMPDENAALVPGCADARGSVASPRPATATEVPCHDELTYPAPLWEFYDHVWVEDLGQFVRLDEERARRPDPVNAGGPLDPAGDPEVLAPSGRPDLGNSWSVPNLGRIRLCNGSKCVPSNDATNPDDLEDRYVAVFGGGLPAEHNQWGLIGNWLYMVDIETGETIYKRELVGSAAAEPAAVDTNNDGYLDRIYVGTTAGYLYRVDLEEYELSAGNTVLRPFPNLETQVVAEVPDPDGGGTLVLTARRVPYEDADGDPVWEPRVIFDTLAPRNLTDSTPVRRPLFMRPSVLFVAELGQYAVNFGTGDREDLWRPDATAARFYTFVDDSDPLDATTFPFVESDLRPVDLEAANVDFNDPTVTERNFLLDRDPGQRGWVLRLDPRERQIAAPFNLSGVTFFVTFTPRFFAESGQCSREGDSRLFAVNTTNANGFLRNELGARTRYSLQGLSFATAPFTEQAQTKNQQSDTDEESSDALTPDLTDIMNELQALFPSNCRFGNYRIDVKTVLDRTEVEFIAPVPVCIIERNWKEFDR